MFNRKIQTVGTISEFLSKEKGIVASEEARHERNFYQGMFPFIMVPALSFPLVSTQTFAAGTVSATKESVSARIIDAFQPITDLVQGLAYPTAFIMVSWAGIKWMLKDREGALQTLQGAAMGFVIVQMAPLIMKLLVSVTAGF